MKVSVVDVSLESTHCGVDVTVTATYCCFPAEAKKEGAPGSS